MRGSLCSLCLLVASTPGLAWAADPPANPPVEVVEAPQPSAPSEPAATAEKQATQEPPAEQEKPLPRIPTDRITYDVQLGARLNPLGLELGTNIAYRRRLFESDSLALRDNNVSVGISPTISPGVARMGGFVEVRPLTILTLGGSFHHVGYFGSFDLLQRFGSASEDFSDTRLEERSEAGLNHPESGIEATAKALALAKVGPIVIRDDLLFTYTNLALEDDERLYYHPRFDVLAENEGWFVHNDTDVVYLSDFGLLAGARFSLTHSFFSEENVGGEAGEDAQTMMRLGPVALFSFFDEPGASFNKPSLVLIAQWWLTHRFRTGEDVNQGIPYIAAAFRFEGDLFRSKD